MLRALPYSLAMHAVTILVVLLIGTRVQAPRVPRHVINVHLGHLPSRAVSEPSRAQPHLPRRPEPIPPSQPVPQPPRKQPQAGKAKQPTKPTPRQVESQPDAIERRAAERSAAASPSANEATTAGPSLGGTDQPFPFAWYTELVRSRIDRNFNPSRLGLSSESSRVCVVHFFIESGGGVAAANVVESSGIAVLDREALRAVQTSHPLPPLPRGFPGNRLGITFIFTTRLDY